MGSSLRRRDPSDGKFHAVLLAGGGGTRFWPMSQADRPKQFLPFADGKPLIVAAWERARKLAPASRVWVVAPRPLVRAIRRALPRLSAANVIVEPSPRDTAPAIGLACATVQRREPAALVGVFPTDHVVRDVPAFVRAVRVAASAARGGDLVCLGIRPDRPATGFGYLRCRVPPRAGTSTPVLRFVEKPDAARARRFLASGNYLWNGGMFVWRVSRFLDTLHDVAPETHGAVVATASGHSDAWSHAARTSVDYAVMEKARGVSVVPLNAGWDDVGSWDSAARLSLERDTRRTPHVIVDSPGSVAFDDEGTTAILGVPGVVVVRTRDALLVVARERAEDVKQLAALVSGSGATTRATKPRRRTV